MSLPTPTQLAELVDLMKRASAERMRSAVLRERLTALLEGVAGFDLVEEVEADGSRSYDVIVDLGADGTLSLAHVAAETTPWALRGAQRWSDAYLVRVDGLELKVGEAIGLLDFVWSERRLVERLLEQCIIRREVLRRGLEATDDEVQTAMDRFRRSHGLLTAEATEAWMARNGVSLTTLEAWAEDIATLARLRAAIAAEATQEQEDRPAHVQRVKVARLTFSDQESAAKAARAIAGGASFYECFEQGWKAGGAASAGSVPAFETRWSHREPAAAAPLFAAGPGGCVGPLELDGHWSLFRIVASERLPLAGDADVEMTVCFDRWMARRRCEARIEWFWAEPTEAALEMDAR